MLKIKTSRLGLLFVLVLMWSVFASLLPMFAIAADPAGSATIVDNKHMDYDNGTGVASYTESGASESDGTSFFKAGDPKFCAKTQNDAGLTADDTAGLAKDIDKFDHVIRDVNTGDKKANYIVYQYQFSVLENSQWHRRTKQDLENSPNLRMAGNSNMRTSCVETFKKEGGITLKDEGNASDAGYRYIDSGYIQSSDKKKSYTVTDPAKPRTFVWTTDPGGCDEYITVNKVGDTTGVLHHNGPSPNVNGTCSSDGYDERDINIADPTVAGVKSSSKPPNTGEDLNGNTSAELDEAAAEEEEDTSCESKGGILGWIMCPVIEILDGVFNWLDTQIQALLIVNKDMYTDDDLYIAWSRVRNIAYIVLIPIMLVMVIGTALGTDLVSAYTVKKAMPRMLAAIVFITFSWYFCTFLIGFFNVIGSGVIGIMTQPFGLGDSLTLAQLFEPSVGGAVGQLGVTFAAGAGVYFGIIALVTSPALLALFGLYMGSAVLIILAAFLVLTARQMFIIALMLLAPLAILAWIFPGNDKMWKIWWSAFSKLLIMYPLIMGLIAIGRIFAYLIGNTPSGGLQGGIINPLLKITAYIIPYLLIPLTFKFAGGVFANLSGMVNDRSKGIGDRLRKSRGKQWEKVGDKAKSGSLARDNFRSATMQRMADRVNARARDATVLGKAGFSMNRRDRRAKMNAAISARETAAAAKGSEHEAVAAILGSDDLINAASAGDRTDASARQFLEELGMTGPELEQNVQAIRQAREAIGAPAFRDLIAAANAGTGTGYGGGSSEMYDEILRTAGGDRAKAARIYNSARGYAEKARRVDLYGVSFGDGMDTMLRYEQGDITADEVNEIVTDRVLASKSAGEIASSRQGAVENMIPALQRRLTRAQATLDEAYASGDTLQIGAAERNFKQVAAATSAFVDIAGQVSPDAADAIATGVLAQPVTGIEEWETVTELAPDLPDVRKVDNGRPVFEADGVTPVLEPATRTVRTGKKKRVTQNVLETVEGLRQDKEFGQFHREYRANEDQRLAAERARLGLPPGEPPKGITGIPGAPK